MKHAWIFAGILFLLPTVVVGQVQITEIMYSPDGADSGREWVEIYNGTDQSITLTEWALKENNTNHRIDAENGQLSSGAFAVIADDKASFQADHDISALLLDSSFGLKNTGESIALVDASNTQVDTVNYTPEDGADGNGNSLQLIGDGWIQASPTPGEPNESSESAPDTEDAEKSSGDETGSFDKSDTDYTPVIRRSSEQKDTKEEPSALTVDAGEDVRVIAGVSVDFVAEVTGTDDQKEDYAYQWSFGNGDEKEGVSTDYTYEHPGQYVATFQAEDDEQTKTDQLTVRVDEPKLSIAKAVAGDDGFIRLATSLDRAFALSGWQLKTPKDKYTLPDYVMILPKTTLTLANTATDLDPKETASLKFPDGDMADSWQATTSQPKPAFVAEGSTSSNTDIRQADDSPTDSTQRDTASQVDASQPDTSSEGEFSGADERVQGERADAGGSTQTLDQPDPPQETTESKPKTKAATGTASTSTSSNQSDAKKLDELFATSQPAAVQESSAGFSNWIALVAVLVIAAAGTLVVVWRLLSKREPQKLLAGDFDIERF